MDEGFQKRVQEAAARFRAGESDVEEIESPAGLLRLVRDPESPQGFRIEAEAGGESIAISVRAFPPSPTRPEGYPPDIPFLPECAAMVNATAHTVTWMNPAEPERSFERLVEATLQAGWDKVELHPVRAGSGGQQQAEFRKPGRERTLFLQVRDGHAQLALMERTPRGESKGAPGGP